MVSTAGLVYLRGGFCESEWMPEDAQYEIPCAVCVFLNVQTHPSLTKSQRCIMSVFLLLHKTSMEFFSLLTSQKEDPFLHRCQQLRFTVFLFLLSRTSTLLYKDWTSWPLFCVPQLPASLLLHTGDNSK